MIEWSCDQSSFLSTLQSRAVLTSESNLNSGTLFDEIRKIFLFLIFRACFLTKATMCGQMYRNVLVAKLNLDIHKFTF